MDSIKVTAKTVADAIMEASIALGTSSDNIEYTVIDKGSSGFFGIGGRKAVIEAKKKFTDEDLMKEVFGDNTEKPKKEVKKEVVKEAAKEVVKEPVKEAVKEVVKETVKEPVKEVKKESQVKENAKKEASSKEEHVKEKRKPQQPKAEGKDQNKKVQNKNQAKPAAKEKAKEAVKEAVKENAEEPAVKTAKVPANPEEAIRRAETFLKDLFRTMGMEVEMKSVFEEDTLAIDITGDDMGILIGKRGQTLDSLQYLTSLVVNKGKASYVRVKLDTEDYRNRRKATLENLAKNIAYKVKKTRRPVFLEPMNPYERRIIHSALQNDPYVTTHSEGEEPCRKVVVTLKKDRRQNEKKEA